MGAWIRLSGIRNESVALDTEYIIGIQGSDSGTSVFLSTGDIVEVEDSFDEVDEKLW